MRISDWSSDVCSSDLRLQLVEAATALILGQGRQHVGRGDRRGPEVPGHEAVRELSTPLTLNAWTLRLKPRSSRDPASSPTTIEPRSEARRVGKELVSTCRSRWSPTP